MPELSDTQTDRQTDRLTSDESMRKQTYTDDEITQCQSYQSDTQTDRQTHL